MSTFEINGYKLDDAEGRWRVTTETKLAAPVMPRATLVDLPMLPGAISVTGAPGTGAISLGMWIDNGKGVGYSHDTALENLSILAAIVYRGSVISYVANTGEKRSAKILRADISEPVFAGIKGAKVSIILTVMPFWYGSVAISDTQQIKNATLQFDSFAGATAPISDAKITITGGKTITLTSPENGTGIIIPGTASPARPIIVDIAARSAKQGGQPIDFDYPPAGLLDLAPTLNSAGTSTRLKLSVTTSLGAPNGTIKIEGRKWYL